MNVFLKWLLSIFLLFVFPFCSGDSEDRAPKYVSEHDTEAKEYVFAIHPLHNPEKLFQVYGPMIDYLNMRIPEAHFRLEASRNYGEFEKKLYGRAYDFALPNPYQTLKSRNHGYHAIAKMGDDHKFTGVILVRRDSGIKKIADLKGKKISYPAPTALAATMMPQYYIDTHGLDVMRDVENIYVGSQESSIINVYMGLVAAGATWPLPWEAFQKNHPDKAAELVLKWETPPLINNGVVARNDMPPELTMKVARALSTMHKTQEGQKILESMPLSRFELANDATYTVIENFLREFRMRVRHPDE